MTITYYDIEKEHRIRQRNAVSKDQKYCAAFGCVIAVVLCALVMAGLTIGFALVSEHIINKDPSGCAFVEFPSRATFEYLVSYSGSRVFTAELEGVPRSAFAQVQPSRKSKQHQVAFVLAMPSKKKSMRIQWNSTQSLWELHNCEGYMNLMTSPTATTTTTTAAAAAAAGTANHQEEEDGGYVLPKDNDNNNGDGDDSKPFATIAKKKGTIITSDQYIVTYMFPTVQQVAVLEPRRMVSDGFIVRRPYDGGGGGNATTTYASATHNPLRKIWRIKATKEAYDAGFDQRLYLALLYLYHTGQVEE